VGFAYLTHQKQSWLGFLPQILLGSLIAGLLQAIAGYQGIQLRDKKEEKRERNAR